MSDIHLNGASYTVVAGSYRKRSALAPAGKEAQRLRLGPFGGGQRQALAERSHGWDSAGVPPVSTARGSSPFPMSARSGTPCPICPAPACAPTA